MGRQTWYKTYSSLSTKEVTSTLRRPPWCGAPTCRIVWPQVPLHQPQLPQPSLCVPGSQCPHTWSSLGPVPQPPGDIQCPQATGESLSPSYRQIFVPQSPQMMGPCRAVPASVITGEEGHSAPCLSHLLSWAQCCPGADLYQLIRADCLQVFLAPCCVTSPSQSCEIGHGRSIYTTVISKH